MRKKHFTIGCLLIAWASFAMAQQHPLQEILPVKEGALVWDTTISRSLIVGSANTALLIEDKIPDIGYATLSGQFFSGKFKRPQEPVSEQAVTFDTERYQRIGNWLFRGRFNYKHQRQQDMRWTDIMDPYRGTPFVLADSTVGDWKKHHFNLEAAASLPLNKRLVMGLAVNYQAGSGAKNRDPRPLNNVNDIVLQPSATWRSNERHIIGLHGQYRSFKEDISILIRAPFVQGLYRIKGLSFHDQILPVSAGYSRAYRGTARGGGMQHLYRANPSFQWLSEAEYIHYTETTQDGTMPPQSSGDFREDRITIRTAIRHRTGVLENTLSATLGIKRGVGHEFHYVSNTLVFDGDMFRYEALNATISHEWMRLRPDVPYSWYLKPSLSYLSYQASYPTSPINSKQSFAQLSASLSGGTWIAKRMAITGVIDFQSALSETLDYHANGEGQTVSPMTLLPDQE